MIMKFAVFPSQEAFDTWHTAFIELLALPKVNVSASNHSLRPESKMTIAYTCSVPHPQDSRVLAQVDTTDLPEGHELTIHDLAWAVSNGWQFDFLIT